MKISALLSEIYPNVKLVAPVETERCKIILKAIIAGLSTSHFLFISTRSCGDLVQVHHVNKTAIVTQVISSIEWKSRVCWTQAKSLLPDPTLHDIITSYRAGPLVGLRDCLPVEYLIILHNDFIHSKKDKKFTYTPVCTFYAATIYYTLDAALQAIGVPRLPRLGENIEKIIIWDEIIHNRPGPIV